MRIVHLGTLIQATFARLDEAGDIVSEKPYTLKLAKFDEAHLANARSELERVREQLDLEVNQAELEERRGRAAQLRVVRPDGDGE